MVALSAEAVFAALLCIPFVARATGIDWRMALLILGICAIGTAINNLVLARLARRRVRWQHFQIAFDLLVLKISTPLALVVASGDPRSPIWPALTLVACIMGAYQDLRPSWAFLAAFVIVPLATIPLFQLRGADPTWSAVGPIINAALAALGYHVLAGFGDAARVLREKQQHTIDEMRRALAQTQRDRLARDLHDSVGSAFSIAGISSDLIEQHAQDPLVLRVARTQREAMTHGLEELRGLLDAMSPTPSDAIDLEGSLRRIAARMIGSAVGVDLSIELGSAASVTIAGAVRFAVLRIFQEAVHNALKHAAATTIRARLATTTSELELEVSDDGHGFAGEPVTQGRGLPGMRARAAELGGHCAITSAPSGTTVRLVLPLTEM